MYEQFIDINFQAKTLKVIEQANAIIAEMREQGYTLTLRQLYYQFVARDLLENRQSNYDRLGKIIDNARKAGLIDWEAIEDRTRFLRRITTYRSVDNFMKRNVRYYAEDLWRSQETYCEVWVEKDALLGVIERPCLDWRVPYFACRGYPSSSELYEAGKRLSRKVDDGKGVFVFYLGDHDPDGIDMARSNDNWLMQFGRTEDINVVRLALNMEQVEEFSPPPNPAKESSARFESYYAEFGSESWELDALSPKVIDGIIRDNIERLIDRDEWDKVAAQEKEAENLYRDMSANVTDIKRYLKYRHLEGANEFGEMVDDVLKNIEARNKEGNEDEA